MPFPFILWGIAVFVKERNGGELLKIESSETLLMIAKPFFALLCQFCFNLLLCQVDLIFVSELVQEAECGMLWWKFGKIAWCEFAWEFHEIRGIGVVPVGARGLPEDHSKYLLLSEEVWKKAYHKCIYSNYFSLIMQRSCLALRSSSAKDNWHYPEIRYRIRWVYHSLEISNSSQTNILFQLKSLKFQTIIFFF